jgi:hypothetical protein
LFSNRFLFRIEYLVLLKLNISDSDNLAILWDLYSIDITATIAYQVAYMCPGLGLPCNLFLVFQDFFPDMICSTAIGVDVCDVRLIHKVCHVLIIDPEPFQ